MYKDFTVAVVVPCFREEKLIGRVIDTMPDFVDHIIVVDDASPDGTREAALAAANERTEVITLPVNKGVGGAIIAGHRRAIEVQADVSVVMAGDAQMDPEYLPALLDPIAEQGYGFAKANRFFSSSSFQNMPKHRIFGNVVLTFLTKAASGYWNLVDPQNGYTAVRCDVLQRLPLDKIAERYEFENDLLIWLNIFDVRAIDVNVPAVYAEEVSTIKLRSVVPRLLALLFRGSIRRMWRKYVLWSFSPIALLSFIGLPLLLLGVVVGIWATAYSLSTGTSASTGTWMLSIAPAIVGIQMLTQALVLDIQATPK